MYIKVIITALFAIFLLFRHILKQFNITEMGRGPLGFYMGVICKCDICSQTLNMLNCHKTYTCEILKS